MFDYGYRKQKRTVLLNCINTVVECDDLIYDERDSTWA